MVELIAKKRDGKALCKEEIEHYIKAVSSGDMDECQIGALCMAIYLNGMDIDETTNLTHSMVNNSLNLTYDIDGPLVDKHSTGGVGDLVSLVLAPILASFGLYVPMISGRGLGHTGGTLDKLDAIRGLDTNLSIDRFKSLLKECGFAITSASKDIVPSDRKIYAIRDISSTVESVPLMVSSILSKKIASGINTLVLDVKSGSGAFIKDLDSSISFANILVKVANSLGVKTSALVTDMSDVLSFSGGNALEIIDAVRYLKDESVSSKLKEVTNALSLEILLSNGVVKDEDEGIREIKQSISTGKAGEIFNKYVYHNAKIPNFLDSYTKHLDKAEFIKNITLEHDGYVQSIDVKELGRVIVSLGGGRDKLDDKLHYGVGLENVAKVGDYINKNEPIATIHAKNEDDYKMVLNRVKNAIKISHEKVPKNRAIYNRVGRV